MDPYEPDDQFFWADFEKSKGGLWKALMKFPLDNDTCRDIYFETVAKLEAAASEAVG